MRRRPWMILGWTGVIAFLIVLSLAAENLDAEIWLTLLLAIRIFETLSDVAADAYCIELGEREPVGQRG